MSKEATPLSKIKRLRREAFFRESHTQYYNVSRNINDYLKELPDFQGVNLERRIAYGVKNKGKVSILDLGCGSGKFLIDVFKLHPGAVDLSGLTALDYRFELEPEEKQLISQSVDYRIGDAQKATEIFQGKTFDFITSVYAFYCFADPLSVLKKCYSLLNPDGIAFIDSVTDGLRPSDVSRLKDYWKGQNIEADFRSSSLRNFPLALKKSESVKKLPIPFSYNRVVYSERSVNYGYRWTETETTTTNNKFYLMMDHKSPQILP